MITSVALGKPGFREDAPTPATLPKTLDAEDDASSKSWIGQRSLDAGTAADRGGGVRLESKRASPGDMLGLASYSDGGVMGPNFFWLFAIFVLAGCGLGASLGVVAFKRAPISARKSACLAGMVCGAGLVIVAWSFWAIEIIYFVMEKLLGYHMP